MIAVHHSIHAICCDRIGGNSFCACVLCLFLNKVDTLKSTIMKKKEEQLQNSLDTLTKATNLVLKGAKLIGANSDVSGPIENGIAPACRALIAPIEMATGTQAYFCGKPNPLMMRTGLNMLGCHSAEVVMVGDRMDTDVISGMESGMSTVLVLSGCSTKDTLKTYAYLPTMVLNGVGDIASMAKAKGSKEP